MNLSRPTAIYGEDVVRDILLVFWVEEKGVFSVRHRLLELGSWKGKEDGGLKIYNLPAQTATLSQRSFCALHIFNYETPRRSIILRGDGLDLEAG